MLDVQSASTQLETTPTLSPVTPGEVDLPLGSLVPSSFEAQLMRRAAYDQRDLEQLAATMHTQQQAIIVRPLPLQDGEPRYEIVAGERRWRAAEIAKLPTIRARISVLTDSQALSVQLIENIQREQVTEIEEAVAFQQLMTSFHLSLADAAASCGKKDSYVRMRLQLLKLIPDARKALAKKQLSVGVAGLLACLTDKQQREALPLIAREDFSGHVMSFKSAQRFIRERFMLALADAPFDIRDATLVPEAGPCSSCPHRSGNRPELFDSAHSDICTHSGCFAQKRAAAIQRRRAEALAQNRTLITGAQAKRLAPNGTHRLEGGYVALDQPCIQDPKRRTFRELLGKRASSAALLEVPGGDELLDVVSIEDVAPVLKKRGLTIPPPGSHSSTPSVSTAASRRSEADRARSRSTKAESDLRWAILKAVRQSTPAILSPAHLRCIAEELFRRIDHESTKRLVKLWAWAAPKRVLEMDFLAIGRHHIAKLEAPDLARFLFDCALVSDLYVSEFSPSKPTRLLAAARLHKVELRQIRRTLLKDQATRKSAGGAKKKSGDPNPPAKTAKKKSRTAGAPKGT
jgi:ParB/RepB/Spo0J family partition protein